MKHFYILLRLFAITSSLVGASGARAEAVFICTGIPIVELGCHYIIRGTEMAPPIIFNVRPGESQVFPDDILGREYCTTYHDFGKSDDQDDEDSKACLFGFTWVNPVNRKDDAFNKPLGEGLARFRCESNPFLLQGCTFIFPDSTKNITVKPGELRDVKATGLGEDFCAIIEPRMPPNYADCSPRISLRKINDNNGHDYTVKPSYRERHIFSEYIESHPDRVAKCVLVSPSRFTAPYDFVRDGLPVIYFVTPEGRFLDSYSGLLSRQQTDLVTSHCLGKWHSEVNPGAAFEKQEFAKIADVPLPAEEALVQALVEAKITYYVYTTGWSCNAKAPGFLASRCEEEDRKLPAPGEEQFPPGYIHCKTATIFLKRDQNTGAGWETSMWPGGTLHFTYWIAAESKTFQGGHEINVQYQHTVIPESAKATLGVKLGCTYEQSASVGTKNGDWKL
jgi:hypothetical protein